MNPKFLRALNELRAGRQVRFVVHHPVRHAVRRVLFRRLEALDTLPVGAIVLIPRGRARESLPPWVAEVRGFSFVGDLTGGERVLVTGPSGELPRWVGRCDILGLQVSDEPAPAPA